MKSLRRLVALALALSFARPGLAADAQWAPFLNFEVYGGRSFFSGSDVNGLNGSFLFVPGFRLGDRWTVLPSLAAGYQKARDVQELAGGGFLTQETQNRLGSLKGIYALAPGWKGKLYGSYKQDLVKETADEKWGNGLFDYNKMDFGAELEREGSLWKSLRLGLDYYTTRFPNFQSLSSQQFGAEIKNGTNVLDFNAVDLSWGGDLKIGAKSQLSGNLLLSQRNFTDQKIVKADGTFTGKDRKDFFTYLGLGWRRQLPTLSVFGLGMENLAGVDFSYAFLNSDQNNYDAGRTKFNRNYYDYTEIGAGPRWNMRFKEKLSVGLGYIFSRRTYADRPVQNADGAYTSTAITSNTQTFRWSLGYPVVKGLAVVAQGALQHAASNMDYQTVYQYGFSSSHYFLGLTYQL